MDRATRCLTRIVLYTEADGQCDKQANVVGRTPTVARPTTVTVAVKIQTRTRTYTRLTASLHANLGQTIAPVTLRVEVERISVSDSAPNAINQQLSANIQLWWMSVDFQLLAYVLPFYGTWDGDRETQRRAQDGQTDTGHTPH